MTITNSGVSAEDARIDLDARPYGKPARTARVRRRRAERRDRRAALRALDFINGVKAFIDAFPGASLVAIRRGFRSIGVEDNSILLFSELMDSASLFLTGNTDTIYALGFVDLSDGPMIVDVPSIPAPSGFLGTVDDMWFRWITDMGLPGPDRGTGGRYLLVGPGYDGPLPDGGFYVSHSRTNRVILLLRAFMIDNDPREALDVIRNRLRISQYTRGGRNRGRTFLAGEAPLAGTAPPAEDDGHRRGLACVVQHGAAERLDVLGGAGRSSSRTNRSDRATPNSSGCWRRSASRRGRNSRR